MKKPIRYKPLQVIMIKKTDGLGLPVPGQVQRLAEPGWVIVDYGALGMKLPIKNIRPLTKREIG